MSAIIYLLYFALTVYAWMIVIRALMSWLRLRPGGAFSRVYRVLFDATEPYVGLFRRVLPVARVGGAGFDFSPVVALLVLFLAMQALVRL